MDTLAFETAFGDCSVSWGERGLTRFMLPAVDAPGHPRPPPPPEGLPDWVREIVEKATLHLRGELQDLTFARLDWSRVSAFQRAVYLATQQVPRGAKASYGEIASRVGLGPEGARGVGAALGSNPWPLVVPCHRVVSRDDRMTGFSAPGGVRTKTRLLVLEGAELLSD